MRRTTFKLYWNELSRTLARKYIRKWTAASREPRSLVQAAAINPVACAAEDLVDNEVEYIKRTIFPQTTFLFEDDIVYVTDPSVVITSPTEVFSGPTRLDLVKTVVATEEDFQTNDFDFLLPYARIPVVNGERNYILYGDIIDNTAQLIEADETGFPIATHTIDVYTRQIIRDQRFYAVGSDDLVNFVRRTATNNNTRTRQWIHTEEVIVDKDNTIVTNSAGDVVPRNQYTIIDGADFAARYNQFTDFDQDGVVDAADKAEFELALGVDITQVTPDEWNNKYRKFDFNKNGVIDEQDRRYFLFFYPSVKDPTGSYILFTRPDIYNINYLAHDSNLIPTSYVLNSAGLNPVYQHSLSPDRKPIFYYDVDGEPGIKGIDDYTYDLRNGVYYVTSNNEKALYAIRTDGSAETYNPKKFVPIGGHIKEKMKVPLGDYYDWQIRGLKWKDGFLYVLIVQKVADVNPQLVVSGVVSGIPDQGVSGTNQGSGTPSGITSGGIFDFEAQLYYQAKIIVFDTHEWFIEKHVDVLEVRERFINPTFFSISDDDVFVIGDSQDLILFDPKRDKVLIRGGRLYSHQPIDLLNNGVNAILQSPYHLWNAFDEYAQVPYGLKRLLGERNRDLLYRMMSVFRFPPGPALYNLSNAIQRDIGFDYGALKPLELALKYKINIENTQAIKLYIDDNEITLKSIRKTLAGLIITTIDNDVFVVQNNTLKIPNTFNFKNIDFVYDSETTGVL